MEIAVGLIQAFMHEPELLILDEPIAGLDPLVQQSFHALLKEVVTGGATVFLSSHTLSEVERVADRVAIIREGRLVVVDSLDNLRAVALRKLVLEFAGQAASREVLEVIAGVREVRFEGTHVIVTYEGSVDPLIKAIAAFEVTALRSRDDDLEELFLAYYRPGP
jgi:ABC-2 type transport system ATP-binding protein